MTRRCFFKMKTIYLFLILIPTLAHSLVSERSFPALVRNDQERPVIEDVILRDLESHDSFDGSYFKIVLGKSDEAIVFNSSKELLFKAATVYHHLTLARRYFVEKMNSSYVKSMPKIVVRLELKNQFSELGHFANDNLNPQFNNALTIPEGKGLISKGIRPWGTEIWFRPTKKIHLRELNVQNMAEQEFTGILAVFRRQIQMQSLQRFLASSVIALTQEGAPSPFALENLIRTMGSSLIIEAGYQFFDPITRVLSRKWYQLETALIPEIIYHEFAHVALSDYLVLSHSTPIIEGMADFFAGEMAMSPKLAMNIKKYNTYNGKNAQRKQDYMLQFESTDYANTDFVFGLLWELKNILGEQKGAPFMFSLRKKLTTNSSIRNQLIEGVLQTCEEECDEPFVNKLQMLKALNLRGI